MHNEPRLQCRAVLPLVFALAIALALASLDPAAARADGDPASDVLLVQPVFYPYQPKASRSLETAIETALHELAHATGVHLKVAIIGTAPELGLVPEFFGHPQAYAAFLDKEISFNQPQALLTVMPAGFGVMPATRAAALVPVRLDARHATDGLTRSAIMAIVAIARYEGHPVATPSLSGSSSGKSSAAVLLFAIPIALLLLAGLLAARRRRSPRES